MKQLFTFIFLYSFVLISLKGQDAHFSQYELVQSYGNPGTIGQMKHDTKLELAYRSQWASIPTGFSTYALGFENKIKQFSWGLNMWQQDAGMAALKTSNINLRLGYTKLLGQEGQSITLGANAGVIQQRFQENQLQFDNQYTAEIGFDAGRSSMETFDKTNVLVPDMSAGILWKNKIGKVKTNLGASISHINEPAMAFYEGEASVYSKRTLFHVDAELPLRVAFSLNPHFHWMRQRTASEWMLGLNAKYQLNTNTQAIFGLSSRKADALIINAGLNFEKARFQLSYDLNTSNLSLATNGKGAVELSAIIYFDWSKSRTLPKTRTTIEPVETIVENKKDTNDSDGDGIPNNFDDCPNIPGQGRFNGCNDADKDGIWDSKDNCPNLYGVESNQGCPTKHQDSDNDGLLDEYDVCPFIKGLPSLNGCPDTDKDGISDMTDHCPFLKGSEKNNGCPDLNESKNNKIENPYQLEKTLSIMVHFDTDKSIIKGQYFSKLDEVAERLLANPDFQAFMSGHTDSEGNSAYNYALSERRVDAVMEYLMDRGVQYNQLKTTFYGEDKPVQNNLDDHGKSRNRRVEVTLLTY